MVVEVVLIQALHQQQKELTVVLEVVLELVLVELL